VDRKLKFGIGIGVALLLVVIFVPLFVQTVPAGHVQVATLFGNVIETTYTEGMHFPVNPLYSFTDYDCRQKCLDCPSVPVPTRDQQTSTIDFSVQYRVNPAACPKAKGEIGGADDVVSVKVVPYLRSLVRAEGKAVAKCEDLFNETVQSTMQVHLQTLLQKDVGDFVIVESVLIRNIELPSHILTAIKNKKVREQKAEEQKAELERFRTEQQQKIAQATAEREAAEQEATKKRVLADAEAYEIEKLNAALAASPAYIQLRALDTLCAMSKDPAAKLYFLDGDSPSPLPLMHIGDK
jgi:regulator of protease activity HflC (stomatin/prohibitin superfamily)